MLSTENVASHEEDEVSTWNVDVEESILTPKLEFHECLADDGLEITLHQLHHCMPRCSDNVYLQHLGHVVSQKTMGQSKIGAPRSHGGAVEIYSIPVQCDL